MDFTITNHQITLFTENVLNQCTFYLHASKLLSWTILENQQAWLYASLFPINFNLHCPYNNLTQITIQDNGLLKTKPECAIERNGFKFTNVTKNKKWISLIISKIKNLNYIKEIYPKIFQSNNTTLEEIYKYLRKSKEKLILSEIEEKLTFIKFNNNKLVCIDIYYNT